jgi:FHA domain-containing protein
MSARLVITSPPPMRGTAFSLSGERTVIGRSPSSDVRVPDSFVSQCHAAVTRQGQRMMLEDLGSRNGTLLNGQTVSAPRALRHGDVIGFGPVEIRFEEGANWGDTGLYNPVQGNAVNFTVDRQRAEMLNNVGRDQYLQQVIHQRDGFLREIAATRTRATRLIWVGVLLMVAGGGLFAAMVIGFMSKVSSGFGDFGSIPSPDFGPTLGGIPVGLLGWAIAAVGSVLVVVGIVLHIVATARRRRAYPTQQR